MIRASLAFALLLLASPALAVDLVLPPAAAYDRGACPPASIGQRGDTIDARQINSENGVSAPVNIDLAAGTVQYGQCFTTARGYSNVQTSPNGGSVRGDDGPNVITGNALNTYGQADAIDGGGGDDTLSAVAVGSTLRGGEGRDTFTAPSARVRKAAAYWPVNPATGRRYTAKAAKAAGVKKLPGYTVTTDAVRDAEPGEIVTRR